MNLNFELIFFVVYFKNAGILANYEENSATDLIVKNMYLDQKQFDFLATI